MATTAIWAINGNLSCVLAYVGDRDKTGNKEFGQAELQSLKDVMDYAINPTKTEKQFYVSGINCDPAIAREQMLITKKRFGKLDGRSAYHGYQSFKPGESTPDKAHDIGVKFAERMWGEEYQVVVATHVDKAHIHNHFVINSVSFVSGRKYHSSCRSYFGKMRVISDELCEEYGLSVVEPAAAEGRRTKQYREWLDEKEGRQTWRGLVKQDIDHALSVSSSWPQFLSALKAQGYEVKTGVKYTAVRPPGKERFIRLRSLGDGYAEESLRQRIQPNRHPQRASPVPRRLPEKQRCRGGWNGSKHRNRPVLVNGEIDETSPCRMRTRACFDWDEHARDEQRHAHEVVKASMPQGSITQGGVISEQKAKRARISEVQYAAPSYIR